MSKYFKRSEIYWGAFHPKTNALLQESEGIPWVRKTKKALMASKIDHPTLGMEVKIYPRKLIIRQLNIFL